MPFKKGQSGNPKGRPPKGDTFAEYLNKEIEELTLEIKATKNTPAKTLKGKEVLAKAWVRLALAGENDSIKLKALSEIRDSIDGKPKQSVDVQEDLNVTEKQSILDVVDMERLNGDEKALIEKILSTDSKNVDKQ